MPPELLPILKETLGKKIKNITITHLVIVYNKLPIYSRQLDHKFFNKYIKFCIQNNYEVLSSKVDYWIKQISLFPVLLYFSRIF